jgi:hypothetical protein
MRLSLQLVRQPILTFLWLMAVAVPVTAQTPRLVPLDTIVLEETAETFLTLPIDLSRTRDGGFLVVDGQAAQVLRYNRVGKSVRSYGAEGEGPGEFRSADLAWQLDDSTLAVAASDPPRLIHYDLRSGAYRKQRQLLGGVTDMYVANHELWLGRLSYAHGKGVVRLHPTSEDRTWLVDLPSEYQEGGPLGIFHKVSLTGWADTLLVGFEPTNHLLVVVNDEVIDTVSVPVRLRRGVPPKPNQYLTELWQTGPYHELFGALSALRALHRQSDGTVLAVYYDHRAEPAPVSSDVFLSVVAPDLQSTCGETPVPLGPNPQPVFGFTGDTTMVLEQRVDDMDVAVTVILYAVDTSDCDWQR